MGKKGVNVLIGREEVIRKSDVKKAIKMGAFIEGMTMTEVARVSGREQCTLSNLLIRGKPSLSSLLEILQGINSKLIIEYSDGSRTELVIEE